jgi:hypothetical protein
MTPPHRIASHRTRTSRPRGSTSPRAGRRNACTSRRELIGRATGGTSMAATSLRNRPAESSPRAGASACGRCTYRHVRGGPAPSASPSASARTVGAPSQRS